MESVGGHALALGIKIAFTPNIVSLSMGAVCEATRNVFSKFERPLTTTKATQTTTDDVICLEHHLL